MKFVISKFVIKSVDCNTKLLFKVNATSIKHLHLGYDDMFIIRIDVMASDIIIQVIKNING